MLSSSIKMGVLAALGAILAVGNVNAAPATGSGATGVSVSQEQVQQNFMDQMYDLNRLIDDPNQVLPDNANTWERWFAQPIDHDDRTKVNNEHDYFDQLYQFENKFMTQNRVALIMESYYGDMSPNWLTSNATGISVYAKNLGAATFSMEHRFYGRSMPITKRQSNAKFPKDLLRYHTSEQNLKDLARFMKWARTPAAGFGLNENTKFIFVGGSYMGMTSAWMRLKYPHLVLASIASSPPVQAKANFFEYAEVVTYALGNTHTGAQCVQTIHDAMRQYETLATSNVTEWKRITGVCESRNWPVLESDGKTVTRPYYTPAAWFYSAFQTVVQYNNPNAAGMTNEKACAAILDAKNGATPLERVARFFFTQNGWYPTSTDGARCWDITPGQATYKGTAGDLWHWQTCNEFGFQQTIDATPKNAFGVFGGGNYKWRPSECAEKFGLTALEENVDSTNTKNGGWDIKQKGIIFTDGDEDPWKALSLRNPSAATEDDVIQPHFNIKGASHCMDLTSRKAYWPQPFADEVARVQGKITKRLQEWIQEALTCKSRNEAHVPTSWCQQANNMGCTSYPTVCQWV